VSQYLTYFDVDGDKGLHVGTLNWSKFPLFDHDGPVGSVPLAAGGDYNVVKVYLLTFLLYAAPTVENAEIRLLMMSFLI